MVTACQLDHSDALSLPASFREQRWYAAYTCANHEKRVASALQAGEVKHFLPLYSSVRRWKDRRVRLELPLFPGYVFVRLALRDRLRVLQIPSVVRLIGFNGQPTPLSETEIEILRRAESGRLRAEPYHYLIVGQRARIMCGPLEGLSGILLRKKGRLRVVLSIDSIARSFVADVDACDIAPLR